MSQSNLAINHIITDIPLENGQQFAFIGNTSTYMRAYTNMVDSLPLGYQKISFNDDLWDFNPFFKDRNSSYYSINFYNLSGELKDYCKFFVLYAIQGTQKISTIRTRYSDFRSVILEIINTTRHTSIYTITTDDIINCVHSRNLAPSSAHNLYEGCHQVYSFIIKNYRLSLPIELDKLKKCGIREVNKAKEMEEERKFPNIPEKYYGIIISRLLEVIRDVSADIEMRMTAALVLILSQTGLRLGDLLRLYEDKLFSKSLPHSGDIAHYIKFTDEKPSKPHSPMLEFNILCTPIAYEAFMLMKELRTQLPDSSKYPYLYILPKKIKREEKYPISESRFNNSYHDLMYTYLQKETSMEWEGISPRKYVIGHVKNPKKEQIKVINVPHTMQYRVHFATYLYNKGVSLVFIQKYMGHLSEYMKGYYVRPKDTFQENLKYSEQVVKEIVEEDLTPLGGSLIGEELKANIKNFIDNHNLDPQSDIDEVMKKFADKLIIRGKSGGVCIKTSLMPCSKDARTNEVMCAYNLCPNLYHFYYMIDISYENFKNLQNTYNALKRNGNTKESQKELFKLKDLCKRKLIPELDELEKELSRKGFNTIIEQHPSLIDIIDRKDEIRKEIELWTKKK